MSHLDIPKLHITPSDVAESLTEYARYVENNGGERNLKLVKRNSREYLSFNLIRPLLMPDWLFDDTTPLPNNTMSRLSSIDDVVEALSDVSDIVKEMYRPAIHKLLGDEFSGEFFAVLDTRQDGNVIWIASKKVILLINMESKF